MYLEEIFFSFVVHPVVYYEVWRLLLLAAVTLIKKQITNDGK
jgi:hypothetical protein